MNRITKTVAIAAFSFLMSSVAFAQKIGYISTDSLIKSMPEYTKAMNIASIYAKGLDKEVVALQTEFKTKLEAYQAEAETLSPLVKQSKEEDLQALQQRISAFQENARVDYQNKTDELLKPIYEKAKKAIESAAKEGGYKYILDSSAGFILYSEPSDDVFGIVKKKLDSMPEIVYPGEGGTTTPKTGGTTTPKTGGTTTPKKPGGN